MVKVDLPGELAAMFRALAAQVPICPNCRNLLRRVRIDEHTGAVLCAECGQVLLVPGLPVCDQLRAFMARSGLTGLLDDLNGAGA